MTGCPVATTGLDDATTVQDSELNLRGFVIVFSFSTYYPVPTLKSRSLLEQNFKVDIKIYSERF